MLVSNLVWLRNALRDLGAILSPFIWGLVIAYLLYPLLKIYSQHLFTPLCKRLLKNKVATISLILILLITLSSI